MSSQVKLSFLFPFLSGDKGKISKAPPQSRSKTAIVTHVALRILARKTDLYFSECVNCSSISTDSANIRWRIKPSRPLASDEMVYLGVSIWQPAFSLVTPVSEEAGMT
ncbi:MULTISPECIES: hypothetical protein [unclassified Sinorhizobium]|uniref:hypothetical protein n=1 Tax=unclassified Sinorhizobium TaxID=2613772 RepID=UPI00352600F7